MSSSCLHVLPIILLAVWCLLPNAQAIKCFQCASYGDNSTCKDPFDAKAAEDANYLKECEDDPKGEKKEFFCRKIWQQVNDDLRVFRMCGWKRHENNRECYRTVSEEYKTVVCQCNGESCNSAPMATATSASLVAIFLGLVAAFRLL